MADKKKMIFNIVFLILVFAGTLYGVFHGEDLGKIVHIVKTVDPLWGSSAIIRYYCYIPCTSTLLQATACHTFHTLYVLSFLICY